MKKPMHERIRSDFEARILAGELAPGDRLPIEQELMQHYGCARMTVNKALSALVAAGLIDRRKKAGTFVARPRVHSMVLDVPDIAAQVRERGQVYTYAPIVRSLRRPDAARIEETALAGNGALLQVDGLHLADAVPLALEHRLVSTNAVPEIADADLRDVPPGSWLLQHVPWTEAENRISAVAASEEEARLLGIPTGAACLCVERRTWRGPEGITNVRQVFRGDSYFLLAHFGSTTPSGGAAVPPA